MGGEDGSVCARYRLQTKGTDWLFRFAMALDRGANLRMAGQLPSPRSGLRDRSTHERGLDQNRHDPPYGAKARLSLLRQVLRDFFACGIRFNGFKCFSTEPGIAFHRTRHLTLNDRLYAVLFTVNTDDGHVFARFLSSCFKS